MELAQADKIAKEVVAKLQPYCTKIEIAGSIRRRKRFDIHDVDLVLIPTSQGQFITSCQALGKFTTKGQLKIVLPQIDVDLYIATPATWTTRYLIRTGSKEHNVMLCKRALSLGMKMHADGRGLFKGETPIQCDTEEAIFQALKLSYKRPEDRK